MNDTGKFRSWPAAAACYVFLTIVGATMMLPLLWMLVTSLRPQESSAGALDFAPLAPHWENYRTAWIETRFDRALFNSVLVTFCVTTAQVFTSMLAAYAFTRLRFFGRDHIFLGYLATMMIPDAIDDSTLHPLPRDGNHRQLLRADPARGLQRLRHVYASAVLPEYPTRAGGGRGNRRVRRPRSLSSRGRPLSKPAVAALAILTFMGAWRSFMWPLIVTQSREMFTLPVALAQFQDMYGVQWSLLMAGSTIMLIPMLIVFAVGQRYFIAGIQLGAVKG